MTSFTWPTCLWWLLRPHRWPWYFLTSSSWNLVFARKQGQAGFGKRTHVQKKECWICVKAGWSNKWVTFIDNQKVRVASRQVALVSSRVLAEQLCWGVFKTSSRNNRNYRIVTRDALMLRNSCLWALGLERRRFDQVSVRHDYVYMARLKSHYSHWSLSDL